MRVESLFGELDGSLVGKPCHFLFLVYNSRTAWKRESPEPRALVPRAGVWACLYKR
jgi:hypothetical protein